MAGRPEGYGNRQMVDAVRYLADTDIKWRAMPTESPLRRPRMYAFLSRWRDTRLIAGLHDRLCEAPPGRGPCSEAECGGHRLAVDEGGRHRRPHFTGLLRRE
ncbi:transposase [Streptomyces sp. NPDC003077]|uniref:transposase n=1 Tax=Streptomyces sp. NPDC003077 TaxID=3154443 RepID=UPI0033B8799D